MATVYKLTDNNNKSKNNTQWGVGVTISAEGDENQELCTDGWIHVYKSAELAFLLQPAHVNYTDTPYRVWVATGTIGRSRQQIVHGCRQLTTNSLDPLVSVSDAARKKFALLCAMEAYSGDAEYTSWAQDWLNGDEDLVVAQTLLDRIGVEARTAAERAAALADSATRRSKEAADISALQTAILKAEAAMTAAQDSIRMARNGVTSERSVRLVDTARERAAESKDLIAGLAATNRRIEIANALTAREIEAAGRVNSTAAGLAAAAASLRCVLTDAFAFEAARAAAMTGSYADGLSVTVDFVAIATQATS